MTKTPQTTDYGKQEKTIQAVTAVVDAAGTAVSGVTNLAGTRRAREQGRQLAETARQDQMRIRDQRHGLEQVNIDQTRQSQDIDMRRERASMRFKAFQTKLQKRQMKNEQMRNGIRNIGMSMQKNEALKDLVFSQFGKGGQ